MAMPLRERKQRQERQLLVGVSVRIGFVLSVALW